ncbi:DUF2065 domain-containing protein [Vibrio rumoiensis 1S-45]|uniref:DUF2065 domain-containing protein n=2 Tax=Vibrio rumoiensis TaxID=76258 RepID=A0A1E5DZQ5_9VIBR|nr:DUF2065 domain-containing protein [Vibrio rumoiensis 1S-45]
MIAVGLLLIFEGMGPALFPKAWRNMIKQMALQSDIQLKQIGSALILVGAVVVFVTLS